MSKMSVRGIGSGKWTGYLYGKPFHRPPTRGDLMHEVDNRADIRLVLTEPALDGAVRTVNIRSGYLSTIRVCKRPGRYHLIEHVSKQGLSASMGDLVSHLRVILPGVGFITPDVETAWLSTSN